MRKFFRGVYLYAEISLNCFTIEEVNGESGREMIKRLPSLIELKIYQKCIF